MTFRKIFTAIKYFILGERDHRLIMMENYNVKTEGELFEALSKNEKENIKILIEKENLLITSEITEVKDIVCFIYSHQRYSTAKNYIIKGELENIISMNDKYFEPTANYLRFFQIIANEEKVFAVAVTYPFELYENQQILWLHELNKKLV